MKHTEKIARSSGYAMYIVTIKYDSTLLKILKALGLVGNRFVALTIRNTIHVGSSISKLSDQAFDHEFRHVCQWHELGIFKFVVKYFYYMIKYGYDKHPMEQEARKFAGEPVR